MPSMAELQEKRNQLAASIEKQRNEFQARVDAGDENLWPDQTKQTWDKTNADFLSGARLDQILHFHYDGTFMAPFILWTPLVVGAAVTVVVVEYFLAIGILLRRWLPAVFLIGFALHLAFYYLLPVSTFSLTMMAMYLFLIPPERVHDFFDRLFAPPNRPLNEPQ